MKTLTLKVTQNSLHYYSENGNTSSIYFTDEMNEDEANPGITEDDPYFLLAQRLANAPQVRVPLKEEGEVTTPGKLSITFSAICVFACQKCLIAFLTFSVPLENIEERKICPICKSVVKDIEDHVKSDHPDIEGVVCPHCCKLLSKKCTLNRHIEQVHLGLQIFKPAKCTECGKVFSKKGHLDRHVRTIHMGLKDESEPCPHCGKIFTTKSSLEPHIEAVHKVNGVRSNARFDNVHQKMANCVRTKMHTQT